MRLDWFASILAIAAGLVFTSFREKEAAADPAGDQPRSESAQWIWGGHAIPPGSENTTLYLFQGKLVKTADGYRFHRQGLYPYPAGAHRLHLVFRLDGMDTSGALPRMMMELREQWLRHGNLVPGFQFDFDCPTGKLEQYSAWLQGIRNALGGDVVLGITGLADWVMSGEKESLRMLIRSADETVFQFYSGPRKITNQARVLDRLESLGLPYKVGFLSNDSAGAALLADPSSRPNCLGYVTFLLP
jgi:hypothetical protein